MIGVSSDDDNGTNAGAAYLFELEDTNWKQILKLTADDGEEYDNFGFPVFISGDDAIIGASGDDNNGSAYLFSFRNLLSVWDFEEDHDVDGVDLKQFIDEYKVTSGYDLTDLENFASEFGGDL